MRSSSSCWSETFQDNKENKLSGERKPYRRIRSRRELLETRVMFPDEFMRSMKNYGPNGPMNIGEKLKPIALVLRPRESRRRYEENFQRASLPTSLRVPSSDYSDTQALGPFTFTQSESKSRQDQERSAARESPADNKEAKRARVDSIDHDTLSASLHDNAKHVGGSSRTSGEQDHVSGMNLHLKQLQDQMQHRFMEFERELKHLKSQGQVGNESTSVLSTTATVIQLPEPTQDDNSGSVDVIPDVLTGPDHYICSDPIRMATEVSKKAAKVNADPAKECLTRDYTRLSTQIVMNETAMKDSLAYVKNLGADEAEVEAHLTQITELATCIDSEKQRRDTALAAVIAQEWKEQRDEFQYIVQQVDQTDTMHASHEKLTRTYSDISQNDVEMLALQAKLKNRLSLLRGSDVYQDTQLQELEMLSSRLAATLSERSLLEDQRQQLCMGLVRSSDAIFKLTMELIEESPLWLP